MPVQIDPQTGERIEPQGGAIQIDPQTGERITAPPAATPEPSFLQKAGNTAMDIGKGAVKGLAHTSNFINKQFFGEPTADNPLYIRPSNMATPEQQQQRLTPQNTAQKVGFGGEQVGEFLLPGGAEEKLASLAPKAIRPAAKIAIGALSSGAVNKAQGGDFLTGAAAGGVGGALGEGLRTLAPKLAESSIGIGKADRAFSKTPGRAILDETSGIRPDTIARTGQNRLDNLMPQLESSAAQSTRMADLSPARQAVKTSMDKAVRQNAESLHGQLVPMQSTLHSNFQTKQAIPQNIPPSDLLDLKRGFSKEYLGRWNPETHGDTIATGRKAYGALDAELDRTVPEAKDLNQRISSLIPVVHRAESTARNAPMAQKVVGRFLAPTGALTSAAFGASQGAAHGLGGAIAGGATGLMTPLVVGTPEGQMLAARLFNSQGTGRAIRALGTPATQGLLNYFRAQKKDTGDQER